MEQYDFDFGDELIMQTNASVEGNSVRVGNQKYTVVIVPPIKTIMKSTLTIISTFLKQGGEVIWVGPLPKRVDGKISPEPEALKTQTGLILLSSMAEVVQALDARVQRPLRIENRFRVPLDGFLSMTRNVGKGKVITIVNTLPAKVEEVFLHFSEKGNLQELDLLTGTSGKVTPSLDTSSGMVIRTTFNPEETKVFAIDPSLPCATEVLEDSYHHPHETLSLVESLSPVSPISLSMENALPLDTCQFSLEGEPWTEEMPIWIGQKQLRQRLGMRPIHYNGAPQRYGWVKTIDHNASVPLRLRFQFFVAVIPEDPVSIAIEKSKGFQVFCNKLPCTPTEIPFVDHFLYKHTIQSLTLGWNELIIDLAYTEDIELEEIYLAGRFGVNPERQITSFPTCLHRGDWCFQGLFHYPGSVTYHYTMSGIPINGNQVYLRLIDFRGALAVVRINDGQPLYALRSGDTLRISHLLHPDTENKVDIEIVGNLRNLLGPFHRAGASCSRISWEDFRTEGSNYSPAYSVEPMGLLGEVVVFTAADR